ncbi:MAG: hypothetical protein NT150_02490 [Bacteroidetes bacterium]|nr:hypothetical protein [Bacteroidota bacterium]
MNAIFKFSILLLLLSACKREKADFIGPAYVSAPAGFEVLNFSASDSTVDFTSDSILYNATFSNEASWILTITGKTSGAICTITGTSSSINNLVWKGTHNEVIFFKKGEIATAVLTFYGTSIISSNSVKILKTRDFRTYGQFPTTGDFETPSLIEPKLGPPKVYSPYWAHFNFPTPIDNVAQGVDSIAIDHDGKQIDAVEGSKYYYIKGKGAQQVFISGMQYTGGFTTPLPNTPDNIWVNMYLYGTGDNNAGVEIEFQEADETPGNPSGYQGAKDDAFVAYITLNHKGWKLFSFKYSDLTASKNLLFGGSGNKIHEPHRLKSFDIIAVKKTTPESAIEVYFDFPIITIGGPFNPSK